MPPRRAKRDCAETLTRGPADAPVHRSVADLLTAIDGVAEAATGDRSFLHLEPEPPRVKRRGGADPDSEA